jgi:hypothetical protein
MSTTAQAALPSLKAQLQQLDAELAAARDRHYSAMQNSPGDAPGIFVAAVSRLEQHRQQLLSDIEAATEAQDRAERAARAAASRAALPQYNKLVGKVANAFRELRASVTELRKFRQRMEDAGSLDPYILESIEYQLGELSDNDRINAVIAQLETR